MICLVMGKLIALKFLNSFLKLLTCIVNLYTDICFFGENKLFVFLANIYELACRNL